MSTVTHALRDQTEPDFESPTTNQNIATTRLRQSFAAVRIKFKWLGTTKTLSPDQKSQAVESFDAEGNSISASKKLIDAKHDSYKALTALKSQITKYWKDHSLAFPEPGIRLIKQVQIEEFDSALGGYRERLEASVRMLSDHYAEIKEAARARLGSLFDLDDYPSVLDEEFQVSWDFPSVDPPEYLRRLNPELYEEQSRQVSARFDRAVEMAEQTFLEELDRLVNHLAERLSGQEDGRPKIFRDSAVTNLNEFFTRFRSLNVGSNAELDELVGRCEQLVTGVDPGGLRNSQSHRRSLSTNLSTVQSSLDQMLVDRPRRNLIRKSRPDGSEQ